MGGYVLNLAKKVVVKALISGGAVLGRQDYLDC